jgi:hypothetical protein
MIRAFGWKQVVELRGFEPMTPDALDNTGEAWSGAKPRATLPLANQPIALICDV